MTKFFKKFVSSVTIVSLILLSVPVFPNVSAVTTLDEAKVTISDSKPEATAVTYVFNFTAAATSSRIVFTFDADWISRSGGLSAVAGDYLCPTGSTETNILANGFNCIGDFASGALTASTTNIVNPEKNAAVGTADTYQITIETQHANEDVKERAKPMIAIIEGVVVTATVDSTLEFEILGVESATSVRDAVVNATSTPTTIPFGDLDHATSTVAAQDLRVATNASDGFNVIVFQNQNLISGAGDTIYCFNDESGVAPVGCYDYTLATPWVSPTGTLDDRETYGFFGFTSTDNTVGASCSSNYYGNAGDNWAGLIGTEHAEVMCHTGPVNKEVEGIGWVRVGYQIEITPLQSAGEYSNLLTYIVTPTY